MGHSICGTQPGSIFWFNWDNYGILNALGAFLVLLFGFYVVFFIILNNDYSGSDHYWTLYFALIYCFGNAFIAHFRCIFTDPGSVPFDSEPINYDIEDNSIMKCTRCNSYKPPRAHHCSVCRRCIVKMDHHCPWINNCVGIRNTKFFVLYLLYVFLCSICGFIMSILHVKWTDGAGHPLDYWPKFCTTSLVVICLLFGLFTFSLLCDMIYVCTTGVTGIDEKQRKTFNYSDRYKAIAEVFGGDGHFSLLWLIPISPYFKNYEDIVGYRYVKPMPSLSQESNTDCQPLLTH
ncbi:hypothetical protein WA158_007639 [Blastocystis sp. Blastoise]